MRVGLVIYGSIDTLSGGYLYDRKLVDGLRSHGDQVEILSLPWQSYGLHLAHNFWPELRKTLAGLKVDVLLQDELNHPSLFLINEWLRKEAGYRLVAIVHHLRSSERHASILQPLYRQIEKGYLRSVDGFIFNSQTTRQEVERLSGEKKPGLVATPGGDGGEGLPGAAHSQWSSGLQILFLGNIIPRKGLLLLLKALDGVDNANWRLRVVGRSDVDPGYFRRVEKAASKGRLRGRVVFCGQLSDEDLARTWAGSHVLCVPSSYEGFGIVYLEAMRSGVVPIGSTQGAAWEIISDGVDGFLVDPNDPIPLRNVLARLAGDPQGVRELQENARAAYQRFPTWAQTTTNIRKFLLEWTGQAG